MAATLRACKGREVNMICFAGFQKNFFALVRNNLCLIKRILGPDNVADRAVMLGSLYHSKGKKLWILILNVLYYLIVLEIKKYKHKLKSSAPYLEHN